MDVSKECLKLEFQNKLQTGNLREGENMEDRKEVGRKA